MKAWTIPLWKKAPFTRLLLPLIAGIIIQRYSPSSTSTLLIPVIIALALLVIIAFSKNIIRYKLRWATGLLVNLVLATAGALIYNQNDVSTRNDWYGKIYHDGDYILASITDVPVSKPNSYKTTARVLTCISDSGLHPSTGNVIIYFEKDSLSKPAYGEKFLFKKQMQEVQNSGNPGAFDYKQYCAFRGIYHQVYLKKNEWISLKSKAINAFDECLINSRQAILNALRKFIHGAAEIGIAEALLIGYKEDLDKDLVQAYSNTGVVHIIAISGLHLGLIYVMLFWIANKIPVVKRCRLCKLILILSSLWLFSLLTGGSASVLRSAVMFSCILAGDTLQRKSSIYNSLAASAFLLLCYNPYLLWDVGFQLSYLAVVGIVALQKPIYNLLYVKNKWLDKVWRLLAVSLAAQIFATPVCIYYFHQFPNYFLLTNLIAVPLSSLILFLEIALLVVAWIPGLPLYLGNLISSLIWLMNEFVFFVQGLPFALTSNIHQGFLETVILYLLILGICYWWLQRSKQAALLSITMLLIIIILRGAGKHHKLIVYNIPKHTAIDFIQGESYYFVGDSVLKPGTKLANFHLLPSRIFHDASNPAGTLTGLEQHGFYYVHGKNIFVTGDKIYLSDSPEKIKLDAVIITKHMRMDIESLSRLFDVKCYVIDASNSMWKIEKLKKECELLHLRCFIVPEHGAYILDL